VRKRERERERKRGRECEREGTSVAVRLPTAACAGAAHDAAAARNGKEIDHIFCMQQWFAA